MAYLEYRLLFPSLEGTQRSVHARYREPRGLRVRRIYAVATMATRNSRLATFGALVCAAVGLGLVFATPWHWLRLVGGGILACAPIGAALIYWSDSAQDGKERGWTLAAAWALVVGASCVTVAMLAVHPSALFRGTPSTRAPVVPRTWNGMPQPLGISGNWDLKLNSDFSGTSLDTSTWRAGLGGTGIGNTSPANKREDDCYNSNNVTFPGDGTMHLNVTATPSSCDGKTHPYTGALISSDPQDGRAIGGYQYKYGVLEAKVFLPRAGSLIANWPAVWTLGQTWPIDGEDDVMEGLFGTACYHFHSLDYASHGPGGCAPRIQPGWHTFASNWQPGSVTYYYDGYRVGAVTVGVTSAPMFIILDNTVWRDTPDITRPSSMRVAYVRVWHSASGNGQTTTTSAQTQTP